jgi:hypothetical protein
MSEEKPPGRLPAILPFREDVPEGYVRFRDGGQLYSLQYLARHPGAEARLRAQAEPVEKSPADEIAWLRRQLAEKDKTIGYLLAQLDAWEATAGRRPRLRRLADLADPAEQERRREVWRHYDAYTVFVLQAMLADLDLDLGAPGKE